MFDSTTNNHY